MKTLSKVIKYTEEKQITIFSSDFIDGRFAFKWTKLEYTFISTTPPPPS